MDIEEARRQIKDLLERRSELTISQNLGISIRNFNRFLKKGYHNSKILNNLPVYLRELNSGKAFSSKEIQNFWLFIERATYHQSRSGRKVKINPLSIQVWIDLACRYPMGDLNLFQQIFYWTVRKIGIFLLDTWSFQINQEQAATLIFKGENGFNHFMAQPPRHGKIYFRKLQPTPNFNLIFLQYSPPHRENVPFYLWETQAFPDLKFATILRSDITLLEIIQI